MFSSQFYHSYDLSYSCSNKYEFHLAFLSTLSNFAGDMPKRSDVLLTAIREGKPMSRACMPFLMNKFIDKGIPSHHLSLWDYNQIERKTEKNISVLRQIRESNSLMVLAKRGFSFIGFMASKIVILVFLRGDAKP